MHRIRFRLGQTPPTRSLQCSPDLIAGSKGRGGKGRRRKGEGRIKGEVGPLTFQTKVMQEWSLLSAIVFLLLPPVPCLLPPLLPPMLSFKPKRHKIAIGWVCAPRQCWGCYDASWTTSLTLLERQQPPIIYFLCIWLSATVWLPGMCPLRNWNVCQVQHIKLQSSDLLTLSNVYFIKSQMQPKSRSVNVWETNHKPFTRHRTHLAAQSAPVVEVVKVGRTY